MKSDIKLSVSLFFNIAVVTVMCMILVISVSPLTGVLFKSGYTAYAQDEKGKVVEQYTYYFDDGEDQKAAALEKEGYILTKVNITSKTGKAVDFVFLTVLSLVILFAFIYNKLYTVGNKDFNAVKCGHIAENKLRGLKIGIAATLPDILLFIATVVLRFADPEMTVAIYKVPNFQFYKILDAAMGQSSLSAVPIWGFIVMFLVLCIVPLISHISYTLGYKDIKLSDKFTYKKGEIK